MANNDGVFNTLSVLSGGSEDAHDTARATNEFQAAWEDAQTESLRHLRNIDKNVAEMLKKGIPMSQSAARDAAGRSRDREDDKEYQESRTRSRRDNVFGRPDGLKKGQRFRHDGRDMDPPDYAQKGKEHKARWEREFDFFNDMLDNTATQFWDDLEDGFFDALGGFDVTKGLKDSLQVMADGLGVDLENVGPELGKMAAGKISDVFKQSSLGQGLKGAFSGVFSNITKSMQSQAAGLEAQLSKTPEDRERIQLNKQNRAADENEAEYEKYNEAFTKGQTNFARHKAMGGEDGWKQFNDVIFGTSQQAARSDSATHTNTPSGTSTGSTSSDIFTDSVIHIHTNSVILSAETAQQSQQSQLALPGGYDDDPMDLVEIGPQGPIDPDSSPEMPEPDYSWTKQDDTFGVKQDSPVDGELGKLAEKFENLGNKLSDNGFFGKFKGILEKGQGKASEWVGKGADWLKSKGGGLGKTGDLVSKIAGQGQGGLSGLVGQASGKLAELLGSGGSGGGLIAGGAGAGASAGAGALTTTAGSTAMTAAGGAAGAAFPWAMVIVAIAKPLIEAALTSIMTAFNDVKEKWGDLKEDIGDAFNRSAKSAEKNRELAQKRYEDDVKSLIEAPFKILEDAAQKVYDAWDENLRQINGTQGYTKAGLQDLMSDYAERLRSEGLASVIGTNDITENLSKVLDSGMSGQIAEEFAYIATKLNAAIPTQDFFSYGETYVSLASQAMQAGKSQSEAIAYANSQLESFASGVLYANRTLTGGFTTGLQDAATLFKQATQIAQTGKSSNASQIASVLTAVSGIVGGVAPDLADGLIDAIYNAAVGGNDSSIVALRSMAGINASNTEFLRQLVSDPQAVFAEMFKGFANLQNMSDDNYMEVAEALSDTFGVSMEAIARVDFNYLARAIENMDTGTSALNENIAHLASGETTTSAEAMRLAKVNEYMIEEGLSYVLDNEVARSIQEHMWDEQIARELMEATYAVELQGSALSFLQSIYNIVDVISTILNPFRLLSKLGDLVTTAAEGQALKADIAQTLLLGQVGKGNASAYHDLITTNADLNLTPSYIALQGGVSAFSALEGARNLKDILNPVGSYGNGLGATQLLTSQVTQSLLGITDMAANAVFSSRDSAYSWGKLSKATASALASANLASSAAVASGSSIATSISSSTAAQDQANAKLEKLLAGDYIKDNYVAQGKTYDDWVKDTKSQGFADVAAALEAAGLSEDDVKGQFSAAEGQMGSEEAAKIEAEEKQMRQIVIINTPLIVAHLKKQEEFQTWQREEAWEAMTAWGQNIQKTLGDPDELSIQSLLGSTGDKESIIGLLGGEGGILPTLAGKDGILEHITNIDDALNNDSSGMKKLLTEMTDYVVRHNVYNQSLNGSTTNSSDSWYESIRKVQNAEKDEASSAIYALAEALTSNMVDLKDPQVAGNALLAQILKVLQVIQTQQAGAGGSTSLADSLIGLALGYTPTSV